ncbi:MAG: S-layer homology domain-containing protein [Clostridia bacterium]|nr:S-layer homology domain-containing protein [Clostridia bacterium]
MYNLKKVIASICVIAMMLTTVAFGATYSDVAEDSAYFEAVETLNKLGIVTGYEDGTYKPEDGVTRAEMAALVSRIQGFGDTAGANANTNFVDVPASHWASGYVASAASMGIINGYGDGNFGPEDNVLFEQAVKMVMATLGYTAYAEYNGGYPGGYMAAAQRYNVTAGVSNATMGTEANRGTIAQLLANAIDTPLMTQKGWNTNGEVEYQINDGKDDTDYKTLMSENLGVVKIRGVVTSNPYTTIDGAKTIDTEEDAVVVIDLEDTYDSSNKDFPTNNDGAPLASCPDTYLVGETDAADYIGMSVIAYVQEVDDEYEIVSIVADTARNDMIEMDLTQFNKINSDNKFEYFKTATAKTATAVKLADDVEVVYNNVGNYATSDIFGTGKVVEEEGDTLNGGKIVLVDNDDTKGYDVIFVEVAQTAVVDEAEEGYVSFKENIFDGYMSEIEVDEDDTNKIVVIAKDGVEISMAELAEWDVLSIIAATADADYILAEVVSNEVIGTITSESNSKTSATTKAYRIGDAKYDVAEGAYGMTGVGVGDGGTFYIDKYGKIAAFDEDAALASGVAANYAYVTAVAYDEDVLTGKDTAIVQMVTADGVVALNIKATGAKLNGATFDITADAYDTEEELAAVINNKLVKYQKNSANNITSIITLDSDSDFTGSATRESAEFDADDNRFVGAGFLDANSYVFFIDTVEAEDSYLGTEADLADGENYTIIAKYADKKAEDYNIVAVEAIKGAAGRKAGLAVITEVGTSENEDGEQILSVGVFANGEEIVADTTSDVYDRVNSDLTVGDIVKVKVDANGVISAINIIFDLDDDNEDGKIDRNGKYGVLATLNWTATGDSDIEEIVGGKVLNYRKNSSTATLFVGTETVEEEGEEVTVDITEEYKLSQADNIIVIDDNGRAIEVKKGSASSFRYYEDLYNAAQVTVTVDGTVLKDGENSYLDAADAQNAADHVYVRKYDGRVTDVVIVKGPDDTKIREYVVAD